MLVLTRKVREQIQIGENVTITILRMKGQAVRVGIEAPTDVPVRRAEIPRIPQEGGGRHQPAPDSFGRDEGAAASPHRLPAISSRLDPGSSTPLRPAPEPGRQPRPASPDSAGHAPPGHWAGSGRRGSGPLMALATRRLRRSRARFIPQGKL